ncbi:MAG TPA: ANTAR domain-containing protein [Streptosporangiaceae bacterium]|nr:ANTAR domain-containing protein [Streptosporangiaceae bacterium]
MEPVFGNYDRAETFQASDAPLLVVDTDLVIRDVNPAYLKVTARTYSELLGTPMFEAFPDNPDDPYATGVANLSASFERVFRGAHRDHMSLQRYDIPSRDAPGAFVRRFWTPVNTPLSDEAGHVFGALHHVEDVTAVVKSFWDPDPGSGSQKDLTGQNIDQQTWSSLVAAFAREVLGHQQARTDAEQLQHALTSRIFIEQAKGMIAAREGVSIDQAFARLRQRARRHNILLHDVARAVVELGLSV